MKVIKEFVLEESKEEIRAEVLACDTGRGLFCLISRRFFGKIQRKPGGGDRTSHVEKTLELQSDRRKQNDS